MSKKRSDTQKQNNLFKTPEIEIDINKISDPFEKAMYKRNPEMYIQIQKNSKLGEIFEKIKTELDEPYETITISKEELHSIDETENGRLKELQKLLSDEEKQALYDYSGIKYSAINKFLRNKDEYLKSLPAFDNEKIESILEKVNKTIGDLDRAFEKSSENSHNRVLYRCISNDDEIQFAEEWADDLGYVEGKTVTFPSYLSTSYSPDRMIEYCNNSSDEAKNIIFKIDTNLGIPVNEVKENSTFIQDVEREILLPRDQSYEIVKVSRDYSFKDEYSDVRPLVIELRQINQRS